MSSNDRKINKEIFFTTIPIIMSNVVTSLSSFVGAIIIASLGYSALSASALIYSVMSVLIMMILSFAIPITILTAQMIGSENQKQIKYIFQDGIHVMLIISCIPLFIMQHSKWILTLFHQPTEAINFASRYFAAFSYGFLPMLLMLAIGQLLMGMRHVKLSFIITLISCSLNLILSTILVGHHFHSYTIGIEGAAYAAVITNWAMLILGIVYLAIHNNFKYYNLFNWSFQGLYIKKIIQMGLPIGVQRSTELLALLMITFFMGWIGKLALSAQQIMMQVTMILLIIPFGFMQAASILISKAYGQNDLTLVKNYMVRLNVISFILMFFLAALFLYVPQIILNCFIKQQEPDLFSLVLTLMPFTLVTLLFDNVRNVSTGVLRGLQDSTKPMLYSVLSLWLVAIPAAYLLATNLQLGSIGISVGWMCGIITGTLLIVYRTYKLLAR